MRDIGKNIKAIRVSKGMTQDALAEALFVTRQTVSNYETGRSKPDLDMLLKIAEIFGVDIHDLIYGLPVPKSKKVAYTQLAISTGVFLLLGAAYWLLSNALEKNISLSFSPARVLDDLLLLPAMLFFFGWSLLQLLGIFCGLRPLRGKWSKTVKVTALVVFGLWIAILIPIDIFTILSLVRSLTSNSVHMVFPYIPVYQEINHFLLKLTVNAPFIYAFLGGLFWIISIPNTTKKEKKP